MASHSDWSELLKAVEKAGWKLRRANHGWRAYPNNAALPSIRLGGTPSDWRAYRNSRAALRRAGLPV